MIMNIALPTGLNCVKKGNARVAVGVELCSENLIRPDGQIQVCY